MANAFYDIFMDTILDGTQGDLSVGTWTVSLFESSAAFFSSDTVISDLPTPTAQGTLTVVVADNQVTVADATITSVPASETITALVVDHDGDLVRWIDQDASLSPLGLLTTGDDVDVKWPGGVLVDLTQI